MPPVKKPPKNAFSFYMDDFIPDLVAKGIRINHKEEAVKHLLPEWKELSKEEKFPYEERAREWKVDHHGRNARPDREKLDCFGIPVVNHESYDENLKKDKEIIAQRISEFTKSFLNGECEILLASYQSQYDDPDERGFCPVEVSLLAYDIKDGIKDLLHIIMDPGPPPYGMKAECRQYAIQTHHIDLFSNRKVCDLLEEEMIPAENLSEVWMKIVDFVEKSQIKSQDDRDYLSMEDGQLLIQTFCSKREYKCVSYCHDWIRMNWPQEDLDFSEQNSSYFKTQIDIPITVNNFIKELYRRYNMQEGVLPKKPPTDDELLRDIDRPLHCTNKVRCDFHQEIDCDCCAQMECYRIAYAISHHLQNLNHELNENHFPQNYDEYAEDVVVARHSNFEYQKTEHLKRYEARQRSQAAERLENLSSCSHSYSSNLHRVKVKDIPIVQPVKQIEPVLKPPLDRVESWVRQVNPQADPELINDYESSSLGSFRPRGVDSESSLSS